MKTVFFYGLFMDDVLLKDKGLHPSKPLTGYVNDYALKIGERATLVKSAGERAYGTIMRLSEEELGKLYGEDSVADYVPEKMCAHTLENGAVEVVAYNLPREKLSGRNRQYARQLARVAASSGLPEDYIKTIEALGR